MAGYGKSEQDGLLTGIVTDNAGRMILSNQINIDTQAHALDIRPLSGAQDSASMTASNVDIRTLTGERDHLGISSRFSAEAQESAVIVALGVRNFLPRDLSAYSENVYYVQNTSALSISVTINLQIAPVNNDSYYINDGSSYSLIGGGTAVFEPSKLMRYARIRVSATLLANVTVYYFGRA